MQMKLPTVLSHRLAFHGMFGLLLMLCYPMQALYAGNQNIYFLWGMAKAGVGSLAFDPLLAESDPFPLFSLLVFAVVKFLHPWVFHFLYWMVNCVYSFSLFGIVDHLLDVHGRPIKLVLFSALFLLMHCGAIWAGLFRVMFNVDLSWVWDSGIAEQGVLRGYLQPSTAGVFLLLSVYFYLKKSQAGAFLPLAVAAVIHANYLFLGAGLGVVYLYFFLADASQQGVKVILWGGLAAMLCLPQLWYVTQAFLPASEGEAAALREAVILSQKGNVHLSPERWLTVKTLLQSIAMAGAIWIYRKQTFGRLMMALILLFGTISTITFATGNQTLLSLTPWRISIILVPLSVALLLGRFFLNEAPKHALSLLLAGGALLLSFGFFRVLGSSEEHFLTYWKWATILAVIIAASLPLIGTEWLRRPAVQWLICGLMGFGAVSSGVLEMAMEHRFRNENPEQGVITFLRKNSTASDLLLIPTELTTLRINAGVAVVADDNLVHGRMLPILMERQQAVSDLFDTDLSTEACERLRTQYGFTAMVVPIEKEIPTDLPIEEVYRDAYYRLLKF